MIIIKYKLSIPSWHSVVPPSWGVSSSGRLQSSLKGKLHSILHVVIYQRYKEGRNYKRVSFKVFLAPLSLTSCFPNTTGRRPAFLEAATYKGTEPGLRQT